MSWKYKLQEYWYKIAHPDLQKKLNNLLAIQCCITKMLINLNFVYPSIRLQKIFLPESQNKYFSSILFAYLKSSTLKFEKAKKSFFTPGE